MGENISWFGKTLKLVTITVTASHSINENIISRVEKEVKFLNKTMSHNED